MIITVKGDRICPICKGFCGDNSYRSKSGKRKRYYCSLNHLKIDKSYLTRFPDWLNDDYEQINVKQIGDK